MKTHHQVMKMRMKRLVVDSIFPKQVQKYSQGDEEEEEEIEPDQEGYEDEVSAYAEIDDIKSRIDTINTMIENPNGIKAKKGAMANPIKVLVRLITEYV